METVPFQYELRPELPNVYGTKDYREFRTILLKMDEILIKSGLEHRLVSQVVNRHSDSFDEPRSSSPQNSCYRYKIVRHALRCNIARHLTGESYRLFSIRLADSTLFRWFTGITSFGCRKAISKSTLDRYEKYFDESQVAQDVRACLAGLSDFDKAHTLGLNDPIDCSNVFMDTTCIKAHIHFPVDWVLLRDAARSLISAIKTIRAKGLKHRMITPHLLLKQMNILCIEMSHTRRKSHSNKQRKTLFRAMKKLSRCIAKHGERYRDLLQERGHETDWTPLQVQQVIRRLENILEQLPQAIKQAHERIIGERKVLSHKKLLSLYDKDARIIIRGKAGSEVEFGQKFLLVEQSDGLILDWQLFNDLPTSDNQHLALILNRLEQYYGALNSACADRGFSSKENDALLKGKNIYNAICSKSPRQFQEQCSTPRFLSLQTRRAQTEARIGLFKNVFLGKPLRSRITENKRYAITWCVLTHNLWVLSRMAIADEQSRLDEAA